MLLPLSAPAALREATLFPDSARIREVLSLPLQPVGDDGLKAVVTLPGQTQPDSLRVSLSGNSCPRIVDQHWRQVVRQDDARLADLRSRLEGLNTERISLFAGLQAIEAQIQFWQGQSKGKAKTLEETATFSLLLGRNVNKAVQEKLTLEPKLQKVEGQIKELQEEINRIAGRKETLWEVTFLFSGDAAGELNITLDYILGGCGWTPLYRLDARPRDKSVDFTWEAEIWQSSGIDWKQIELSLATLPLRPSLNPPVLPPWVIRPRPTLPTSRTRAKADFMTAPNAEMLTAAAGSEEPRETRRSTYALWNLGRRDVPAGARQRIKVREEVWPAEFLHLLRPSVTPQAYIHAFVQFPETREIPSGPATFLIDGALLGKRPFRIAGREENFFFGIDPLVTVETRLLSRKAGEKGFLADRQTQEWAWRFDIRNDRADAIRIRLEDPPPQARDERIKLYLTYDPEPSDKSIDIMIWKRDIPAGSKASILTTIRLEAPKEMDLDLGWRQ
jgi:hypothetical protein